MAIRISTVLLALCLLVGQPAWAGVGFETLTIPDPQGGSIEVGIWYPAASHMQPAAGDPAPVVGEGLPLVVLSHGNGGHFGGHSDTAIALAEAGFVAAALTHGGDNHLDQSLATDMPNRPRQLSILIDYLLQDWRGRAHIDPRRIGAFGFSSGGFTVLAAIGARPDPAAVIDHCRHRNDFSDCRLRAAHPTASPETWRWRPDARIRAVVSAAPALGYSFTAESLAGIRIPVQLWQAEHDEILPSPHYVEPVRARLSSPEYHLVQGAGHFDFLKPCSAELARAVPEICTSRPGFDRTAFHATFNREVVRFFRDNLAAATDVAAAE
ncbi:dienelactone hydrolase [Sphingosinicella sp. LHD-64]|uniref:alpha/beta hydrolase family protein n=1 Tax=Sphingosinicella sp. LHD-64 TaxID=3072139 RepID=UPI00280EB24C|nr:dienelactone hydrolase [Sphingosinicella sp. LHD-64]MDQ8755223.1 dienelactone hydrolase [Sphingosinicella sp. LHD-64]